MAQKYITLAAWRPKAVPERLPGLTFPENWRLGLEPLGRKLKYNYPTASLNNLILGWQEGIVKCNPLRIGGDNSEWIVGLHEFSDDDLKRLHRIFGIWVRAEFSQGNSEDDINVFLEKTTWKDLIDCRVECSGTTDTLRLMAVNALQGKKLEIAGMSIGPMCPCGIKEIISPPMRQGQNAFSIGLDFFISQIGGETILACRPKTRRWAGKAWAKKTDREYSLRQRIFAHIGVGDGKLRKIVIGKKRKWDIVGMECLRMKYPSLNIPDAAEILSAPEIWIDGFPQILVPWKIGMAGFDCKGIGAGISVKEVAELVPQIGETLQDFVEQEALQAMNVDRKPVHFPNLFFDLDCGEWNDLRKSKVSAVKKMPLADRRKKFLAHIQNCIGLPVLNIEIWAPPNEPLREIIAKKFEKILGVAENNEETSIKISFHNTGMLTDPLANESIRAAGDRICAGLEKCANPTASIFVIPEAGDYRTSGAKRDPKNAIRNGFAKSGRVIQFVNPLAESEIECLKRNLADISEVKERKKHEKNLKAVHGKLENAIWDIFRQTGMVAMPLYGSPKIAPVCIGLHVVYIKTGKKGRIRFPVLVRLDPLMGTVRVKCHIFKNPNWLPYPQACSEMARLDLADGGIKPIPGSQEICHGLRAEFNSLDNPALLCADKTNAGYMFDCAISGLADSGIRIVMFDSNVLSYYTQAGKNPGQRMRTSGVFSFGKDFLSIADPGIMGQAYACSYQQSRMENASKDFRHPGLVGYRFLHLKEHDDPILWVSFLDETRKAAIQYMDQPLILPLPLHLANQLEEYILPDQPENEDD